MPFQATAVQRSADDVWGFWWSALACLIARSTTNDCWFAEVRRLGRGFALG